MAAPAPENPKAASTPMIEITTSNSIRVNPRTGGIFQAGGFIRLSCGGESHIPSLRSQSTHPQETFVATQ